MVVVFANFWIIDDINDFNFHKFTQKLKIYSYSHKNKNTD